MRGIATLAAKLIKSLAFFRRGVSNVGSARYQSAVNSPFTGTYTKQEDIDGWNCIERLRMGFNLQTKCDVMGPIKHFMGCRLGVLKFLAHSAALLTLCCKS